MSEARYDPVAHRFKPDPGLIARVQRSMMADEDLAGGSARFVRQRWEEAFGAVRVALDALREVYPFERDAMGREAEAAIATSLEALTVVFARLDAIATDMLGETMHNVLTGRITSHEALDNQGIPR